jgi:hypothetical protein
MNAPMTSLFAPVGKSINSNEVVSLLDLIAPVRVSDDPPYRSYIGSPQQGVDLVVEDERVRAVQVYTKRTSTFSAYAHTLPLGIRAEMSQVELRELLGPPLNESEVSSQYVISEFGAKLTLSFRQGEMCLLSIGIL